MQQLTKSLGSFTWAMSLFGLQQMTGALGGRSGQSDSEMAASAIDEVTRVTMEQCPAAMRETFEVGDKLQRDLIDMIYRLIPLGNGRSGGESCSCANPMDLVRRAADMARGATAGAHPSRMPEEEMGWGPVPPVA